MNIKRFILAVAAVLVVDQIFSIVIHQVILASAYQSLTHLWRAEMMDLMWVMWITSVLFSILFVYIFVKGYEGKGVVEGIRYGLVMGLLMMGTSAFGQYVVYPVPFALAIQWFAYGIGTFVVLGIVVSLIYKPSE